MRWFRSARSRPPVPLPPPRAPLRSLLPPAARRFAPAPRWSVLLNCGGARRACGAGRPRRALAFARPAPRRAGKFFPPLPARLVLWVGLRPVPSPSLRSASALPLARPRSPIVRLAAVPYYTRSRCGARVTRAGFRPPVAPFRSARFGHLWRRRRGCAASVFLFHLIIQKQLAVNKKTSRKCDIMLTKNGLKKRASHVIILIGLTTKYYNESEAQSLCVMISQMKGKVNQGFCERFLSGKNKMST